MTATDAPPSTTAADERPGQWISLPGFSRYEAYSPGGYGLDPSQWPVRNKAKGTRLKVTPGHQRIPAGPALPRRGQTGNPRVHALLMLANVGPPPPGRKPATSTPIPSTTGGPPAAPTRKSKRPGGTCGTAPARNSAKTRWPRAPPSPRPPHSPAPPLRCHGRLRGARCTPCMGEAGIHAAAMLTDGMPLARVTRKLDYTSEAYVHALARQYGGYKGTLAQARAQQRPLLRRVLGGFRRAAGERHAPQPDPATPVTHRDTHAARRRHRPQRSPSVTRRATQGPRAGAGHQPWPSLPPDWDNWDILPLGHGCDSP